MPDDDELEMPEGLDPNIRAELRKAREYAQRAEAAEAEAAAAKREAAFAKAGVPDTPLATALAKTYEGENDPAAVKAYFEGLGVDLSGKAPDEPSDAELDEQRRLAAVGAQGGQGGDVRFEDAINSAKNTDEVMALLENAPEGARDYDGRRIGAPRIE